MNFFFGIQFVSLVIAIFLPQNDSSSAFHRFESKLHGFTIQVPDGFEEIPVQPGEGTILHRFADRKAQADFQAQLWVLSFAKSTPPTGAAANFESWAREKLSNWTPSKPAPLAAVAGVAPSLVRLQANVAGTPKGFAYSLDGNNRILVALGFAQASLGQAANDGAWEKVFEYAARSLREKAPSNPLDVDWESFYRGNIYRHIPYRIEVRKRLAQGWKAEDTENFIVVASAADVQLVGKVKRDLETIRTKFAEMFPPVSEIQAISTVRVCKDLEEFRKYSGAPPNVAGYWNPKSEELVFFDASAIPSPANRKGEMSYVVLYHEAFHQYIHYAVGQAEIHSWCNEGLGDYFSGAVIGKNAKRVARVEANPFRLPTAKQLIAQEKWLPCEKLVRMEQSAYYADAARCYAQGWALVYFLLESREAKKNAAWSRIVKTYFETLRANGSKQTALDAAFAGVDFGKLDEACKAFIAELEEPK